MIKEAQKLISSIEQEESALTRTILLTKAIAALDNAKRQLCCEANSEYAALEKISMNQCVTIHNLATLTHNSNKSTWVYPRSVCLLEQQLRAAQKNAQSDGTAQKVEAPPIDIERAFLFKIKLL